MRIQFDRPEINALIKSGMTVAIAVGSRGIANIALIIKETVAFLKSRGASSFVVPAMTYEMRPEIEEDYRQIKTFWKIQDFKSSY